MYTSRNFLNAGAVLGVLGVLTLAAGCDGNDGPGCLVGAEGCACTSARACEAGLTCSATLDRCERASGPAPTTTAMTTTILEGAQLHTPRDLAFNPRRPAELWVVNAATNSVTIIHNATEPGRTMVEERRDRNHSHFMPSPTSLAFGADETNDAAPNPALAPGTFGTCQESRNGGDNFMGPVLWSSDLSVFAARNGLLGSHLDMLHQSPDCMGIAWGGSGNVYWTFDGLSSSVSRYDFQLDHGVGNDDHADGIILRYGAGQFKSVPRVPSHLYFRAEDQMVYIADTGNGRVVKLAAGSGTKAGALDPKLDEAESWQMAGALFTEVVPRGTLTMPSGLEIQGEHLYVSDNATSLIHKFGLDGRKVAAIQTDAQPGGLAGMIFGPDRRLYFVDQVGNRVLRVDSPF
jgi:hypothetical protein